MNENGKPGVELGAEALEQVSGGSKDQYKTQRCNHCKDETTWIKVRGVWVCGKCGRGGPIIL